MPKSMSSAYVTVAKHKTSCDLTEASRTGEVQGLWGTRPRRSHLAAGPACWSRHLACSRARRVPGPGNLNLVLRAGRIALGLRLPLGECTPCIPARGHRAPPNDPKLGRRSHLQPTLMDNQKIATGRRNTGIKAICRGLEAQRLARPLIQPSRHCVQLRPRVCRQVGSRWEVPSEQAVGVLISPLLPGTAQVRALIAALIRAGGTPQSVWKSPHRILHRRLRPTRACSYR